MYSKFTSPKSRFLSIILENVDEPEGREHIRSKVPMGRLGDPEEAGELISFLVSGQSTFTTGQIINITGGLKVALRLIRLRFAGRSVLAEALMLRAEF